jgi:hypothetical protein
MLPLPDQHQLELERLREQAERARKANMTSGGGGLLGNSPLASQGATGATQGGSTDYLGLAKQGKDAYDLFQSGEGGGLGGYAAAATAFKKFMDWSFDKDATGGGIGRTNIHVLEDMWQPFKGVISDGSDIAGNVLSDVGGFFKGLF